jgi:hypothetical protein
METSHIETLEKVMLQFSEEEEKLADLNRFAYIFTKAWLYLKLGPTRYSNDDAFNQPSSDTEEEVLQMLDKGCRQVIEGVGLTSENPFTGLNVVGFSALFELFHFKKVKRKCKHGLVLNNKRGALDCIIFQH